MNSLDLASCIHGCELCSLQINLGNMYYWGYGVDKNWEKSRELYKEAAKNNTNAQLLLQELEDELKAINNSDNSN